MPTTPDPAGERMLRLAIDRLKLWMQAEGLTQSAVSRAIGYDQSNISNWFNVTPTRGKRQEPRMVPILRIADHYKLSLDWLATGKGPRYRDPNDVSAGQRETRGAMEALARVDVAVSQIRREFDRPTGAAEAVGPEQASELAGLLRPQPKPKRKAR